MSKRFTEQQDAARRVVELEQRLAPTQARAKQTVNLILDTAATLLEEVGIDVFNTNLLAKRAGIGIRTIYRYFPNKLAVVVGLASREFRHPETWRASLAALSDPEQSWRRAIWSMLEVYAAWLENTPGAVALRSAMMAIPELRHVEYREFGGLEAHMAAAAARRGIDLPQEKLHLVFRVAMAVCRAHFDDALARHGHVPPEVIEELQLLHERYLRRYLDP